MRKFPFFIFSLLFLFSVFSLHAAKPRIVSWKSGDTVFKGEFTPGKKSLPLVVIFHQWMGLSEHERDVASRLNRLGFPVLAADVFGQGNMPTDRDSARKLTATFYQDRVKLRQHALLAVEKGTELAKVSLQQTVAIGYCFGGATVLELSRTAVPLKGVVSLHGGLATPNTNDNAAISCKVLVLHGAEDQSIRMQEVNQFIESMRANKKDWSLHVFADAVHGFTHRHDPERYNRIADERSWKIMLDFLQEQ